ncbi:WYL domain-containing protein [Variovorax rhizosphaerae]|uniref:WYL domain-containing protein n=1 Tax=Variovorax rhizosphaerae TaxID=1836200 RepID=A0ABU8WRL7_9BURK
MTDTSFQSGATRSGELETILEWEGRLDNARIREVLGVKSVWASRLIAELVERLGTRVRRPQKHGPLIAAGASSRKKGSPDEYLRLLATSPEGLAGQSLVHDARVDMTSVAPPVFAAVRYAAQSGTGLQIVYRSMSTPEGQTRLVFPHALVRAPRRWHMRAWCNSREAFRDFVLARIDGVQAAPVAAPRHPKDDKAWHHLVDLTVVPHPSLTSAQQALIAAEYFPGARARRLRVREALAPYILQDLRVAIDPVREQPPAYQLLLAPASSAAHFKAGGRV